MRISRNSYRLCSAVMIVPLLGGLIMGADRPDGSLRGPSVPPAAASGEPNDLRWDLTGWFQVAPVSVTLSSRTVLPTAGEKPSGAIGERTLSISTKLDILNTNGLVGLDIIDLGIVSVRDEDGKDIRCLSSQYQYLRQYQQVKWGYAGDPIRDTLLPSGFTPVLRLDPNQPTPPSLSRIEAYLYALYADDKIQVDVPFGPPRDWVDAAPGLQIIVAPDTPPPPGPIQLSPRGSSAPSAYASPLAIYEIWTCVQSTAGRPVVGLEDPWPLAVPWSLGDYVVVEVSLYDHVKGYGMFLNNQSVWSDPWGYNGAICSGWPDKT